MEFVGKGKCRHGDCLFEGLIVESWEKLEPIMLRIAVANALFHPIRSLGYFSLFISQGKLASFMRDIPKFYKSLLEIGGER